MATQNRHLTPKKTTLDEAIATDIAINIIAIQYLKFFLKKLSKNVATCLTLTGWLGKYLVIQLYKVVFFISGCSVTNSHFLIHFWQRAEHT